MKEAEVREGGCLCGAVRYRAAGAPRFVAYCHCQSCRRATGAPVSAYAGYPSEQVTFVKGRPKAHQSSAGVTRSFCSACGSPLTYEGERWPNEIHIHLGTLDDPSGLPPEGHAFEEERLVWLRLAKG